LAVRSGERLDALMRVVALADVGYFVFVAHVGKSREMGGYLPARYPDSPARSTIVHSDRALAATKKKRP
jgi:hypothetical protein